jgi:PleD family two-component response regulator
LRKGRFAASSGNLLTLTDKTLLASTGVRALHSAIDADAALAHLPLGGTAFKSYNAKEASLLGIESVMGVSSAPLRVLSVDDDPINQMVIQSLLEPEGYEVSDG